MKKQQFKYLIGLIAFLLLQVQILLAQCSVCTKTAEQLGEKPGKGLNAGIIYLMLIPLIFIGIAVYRFFFKKPDNIA